MSIYTRTFAMKYFKETKQISQLEAQEWRIDSCNIITVHWNWYVNIALIGGVWETHFAFIDVHYSERKPDTGP
jgi:hypothetical protein